MIYLQGITDIHEIDLVWKLFEPLINKALQRNYSSLTPRIVYEEILSNNMQLWVLKQRHCYLGVVITEIQMNPMGNLLFIVIMAGKKILEYISFIESVLTAFAKQHHCVGIAFSGRKGWNRVLKNYSIISYNYLKLFNKKEETWEANQNQKHKK